MLGSASVGVGGVGMGVLEPAQRLSRRSMPMGIASLSAEEPSLPSRKSSDWESPPPPRNTAFGKRMGFAGELGGGGKERDCVISFQHKTCAFHHSSSLNACSMGSWERLKSRCGCKSNR